MITKVVGVTFSNEDGSSRARIIASMSESDQICLERDPYNEFDSNAVKVCVVKGGEKKQIGFLAKDIASTISPKLRKGIKFNVSIIGCGMWNDRPFCEIDIQERAASETSTTSASSVRPIAPQPIMPKAPAAPNPALKNPVQDNVYRVHTTQPRPNNTPSSNNNVRSTANNSGCMVVLIVAVVITGLIAIL